MQKEKKGRLNKEVGTYSLLDVNKARESLKDLDGWQLTDDHRMIYREFILQDFMAAIDLIDRIAVIAEDEKHHPDMHLTQYRNLRVGLTTHDVGGLSEKDFTVALKITDEHKDRPVQKPRYEQKEIRPKQKKSISPASIIKPKPRIRPVL